MAEVVELAVVDMVLVKLEVEELVFVIVVLPWYCTPEGPKIIWGYVGLYGVSKDIEGFGFRIYGRESQHQIMRYLGLGQ